MKLQITNASLVLVNPKLPESDPLKYRHNTLKLPSNITNVIDTIAYSWVANFKRCVPQEELNKYRCDSFTLSLRSGSKVYYQFDEVDLSISFEGNLSNDDFEVMKSMGMEITKKLMSLGMLRM